MKKSQIDKLQIRNSTVDFLVFRRIPMRMESKSGYKITMFG